MKVGRVYVIDWLDHCDSADSNAWVPLPHAAAEPARLRTVGYLVSKGRQAISVAHTMDSEHSTAPFTLVRSAILSMIELDLPPATIRKIRKKRTPKPKTEETNGPQALHEASPPTD